MKVLVVDDEPSIRFALAELLDDSGFEVREAAHAPAALERLGENPADLILSDLVMPAMDGLQLLDEVRTRHPESLFVLFTAHGDERTAVRALKAGAYDYIPKPWDNEEIRALVRRAREVLALRAENSRLRDQLAGEFRGLVGDAAPLREVVRVVRRAAPTDATVLVTGESGSGKEVVARALHAESRRARGPFVALNCSALPGELAEAELFGAMRGAFTGAVADREGLFEAAGGGTLFLDEIGDLALPAQAKLLRVLEERQVTRLGSTRPIPIDVRLVAATNRPLEQMVRDGSFRADLLFRLEVIPLALPPLRERRGDIPALAVRFVAEFAARHGSPVRHLSDAARRVLIAYDWPGNVRELRNTMERAVVLGEGDTLDLADLPPHLSGGASALRPAEAAIADQPFAMARDHAMAEWERGFLIAALQRHGGNVSAAARAMDLHRQSLQKKLRELGIDRAATAIDDG